MLYLCCFSCMSLRIHDEHFCRCVFTTDKFLLKCVLKKKKKMWSASQKKGVAWQQWPLRKAKQVFPEDFSGYLQPSFWMIYLNIVLRIYHLHYEREPFNTQTPQIYTIYWVARFPLPQLAACPSPLLLTLNLPRPPWERLFGCSFGRDGVMP